MSNRSPKVVLIADPRPDVVEELAKLLTEGGFAVRAATSEIKAIELFYADPPECIIVNHRMMASTNRPLLDEFRSDNVYGHLPAVVILSPQDLECGMDWSHVPADDFLMEPLRATDVISRIRLCFTRAQRDVNANPLTGLPGNLTISREAEHRLAAGKPFAFAYIDIDYFKAFNDRYGFSRGDEVIRMAGRVIVNAIRSLGSGETYVGHIGGDDFVVITPSDLIYPACQRITSHFDLIVRDFYDVQDRENGYIQSIDRKGKPQTFPLMSLSIGAVDTSITQVEHIAQLIERVTEVKSFAKRLEGSSFIIDRRKK